MYLNMRNEIQFLLFILRERKSYARPCSQDNCNWILEPWRLDRSVVPKRQQEITTTRCVIAQKSAVLSYFSAEACNHAFGLI